MDEVAWPDRGYYLVEVDTGPPAGGRQTVKHIARLVRNPRRPFLRLSFSVETCDNPEALYAAAEKFARSESVKAARHIGGAQPVVEMALEGVLPFDRRELDMKRLEVIVQSTFDPLLVRVTNLTVPTEYEVSGDEAKSRAELERKVLEDLVERDARYRPAAAEWTNLILNVKRMALEDTSPEGIVEYLQSAKVS